MKRGKYNTATLKSHKLINRLLFRLLEDWQFKEFTRFEIEKKFSGCSNQRLRKLLDVMCEMNPPVLTLDEREGIKYYELTDEMREIGGNQIRKAKKLIKHCKEVKHGGLSDTEALRFYVLIMKNEEKPLSQDELVEFVDLAVRGQPDILDKLVERFKSSSFKL